MNENPYQSPRPYREPASEQDTLPLGDAPINQGVLSVLSHALLMAGVVTTGIGFLLYVDGARIDLLLAGGLTVGGGVIARLFAGNKKT